jgi:hypothetical protein
VEFDSDRIDQLPIWLQVVVGSGLLFAAIAIVYTVVSSLIQA